MKGTDIKERKKLSSFFGVLSLSLGANIGEAYTTDKSTGEKRYQKPQKHFIIESNIPCNPA